MCVCVCVFFQLNEARTNIMDTNHRLMAVTAEFSIKQATTLSLQQEIKEKEHQVISLQHFLPPSLTVSLTVTSYTPVLLKLYWKLSSEV